MSAILKTADLTAAVRFAKRACEARNTIPILSHMVLKTGRGVLEIETTDLDRVISVMIPAEVGKPPMALCVPGRGLENALRERNGRLAIDPREKSIDGARLTFEDLEVSLIGCPMTDWPTMEDKPFSHTFQINSEVWSDALTRVKRCISTEETRYYLNGVFLHHYEEPDRTEETGRGKGKTKTVIKGKSVLRMVATDGHKLGLIDLPLPDGAKGMPSVIIPASTVLDMIASCDAKGALPTATLRVGRERVQFEHGHIKITSKIIDGTFPDYQRFIPRGNDKLAVFDRAELQKSLNAVTCILKGTQTYGTKFSFNKATCIISATMPDTGTANRTLTLDYNYPPLDIGFNYSYLNTILDALTSKCVCMKLADPGSLTMIMGYDEEEKDVLFVLMPMRV